MPRYIFIWRGFLFLEIKSEDLMEDIDRMYMRLAMSLAERGKGFVNPNPLVGAVIVRDDRVVAEGWHERYGGLHAERNAFKNCVEDPKGATLYVTLEPCCHYGKTPPCTEAILEAGIARVVVGLTDPNPLVAGKGLQILKDAGIEIVTGVEEEVLKQQNRVFLKYITTKMPWVVMKTAMTLDGKIAACTGDSKWVTGEEARQRVQQMRAEYMAIMAGAGTVKADNPMLNCRLKGEHRQPVRIIVDSKAAIDGDTNIVKTALEFRTIVAHTVKAEPAKLKRLVEAGVETLSCEELGGKVDMSHLLKQLGALGIDSVLLEGGGELNYSCLEGGLVDEVFAFIAPKLIGGRDAKTPVEGDGLHRMNDAVHLERLALEQVGEDILINGRCVNHNSHRN